jgi:hypothetical protein
LLGAGYGDHEITNYLHSRFCNSSDTADSLLCRIIIFNDDEFSHWVFFAGFVFINAAMMLAQVIFPHNGAKTKSDLSMLIGNGFIIGLAIFANLAFERIGIDLYIIALLMLLSWFLFWLRGAQPLLVYYTDGYTLAFLGTLIYKAFL